MFRAADYLNLADFEPAAQRKLPRRIFGYIEGGAEDGASVAGNRAAFAQFALEPRVLVDTAARSCASELFGRQWAAPFGIAPMGAMGLAGFHADLALARAAARANVPFVLSGASLVSMERVIQANPAAWFQAYLSAEPDENDRLLARVDAAGFETLVVTVDVPVGGNREQDLRNGYTSPLRPSVGLAVDGMLHPRWLAGTFVRSLWREGMPHFENFALARVPMVSLQATRLHRRDNLTWDVVRRLRERWKRRLVLKGVLSAQDAVLAQQAGLDGVIASNHGGRQLDGAVSALHGLQAMREQAPALTVLYDGGIRRGTDVLKALALGASMVFVGRPFAYAVAVGGERGALRAIELLQSELLRNMALLGCARLDTERLAQSLVRWVRNSAS